MYKKMKASFLIPFGLLTRLRFAFESFKSHSLLEASLLRSKCAIGSEPEFILNKSLNKNPRLLEREPLSLHATILLIVGGKGLLPATPYRLESGLINLMLFDEQSFDLSRSLLAEVNRSQSHLPDQLVSTLSAKLLNPGIVDVPAKQDSRPWTDLQESFDGVEIAKVLLRTEVETGGVRIEQESNVFRQKRISLDSAADG
jgi:hypothetical protein